MLGWEYPPHISGGLGTACEGLSKALARLGVDIDFVVPHLFGGENAAHMNLIGSLDALTEAARSGTLPTLRSRKRGKAARSKSASAKIRTLRVASPLTPYMPGMATSASADYLESMLGGRLHALQGAQLVGGLQDQTLLRILNRPLNEVLHEHTFNNRNVQRYSGDMFGEVRRFTDSIVALMRSNDCDVVHAHDWMTYPAAVALARIANIPLVVHVHSIESDRSGAGANQRISQIESWGMHSADVVVAVSYYTREQIHKHYKVPLDKIQVVHNGVYLKQVVQHYRAMETVPSKVVLFLGRVTMQKGPDYFVEAAAKVIPHVPDVMFVMAGSGDMLPRMIERVHNLGIAKHFLFTGFLKGEEVERMFSLADVYVMPSVSEPFGISALEAISFETPVILSRQSGVAEVLKHTLKADFWDTDRLADLMINALLHEELRNDMIMMAREEVKRVHWQASAMKTIEVYDKALGVPA